jgi:hypothetical protein
VLLLLLTEVSSTIVAASGAVIFGWGVLETTRPVTVFVACLNVATSPTVYLRPSRTWMVRSVPLPLPLLSPLLARLEPPSTVPRVILYSDSACSHCRCLCADGYQGKSEPYGSFDTRSRPFSVMTRPSGPTITSVGMPLTPYLQRSPSGRRAHAGYTQGTRREQQRSVCDETTTCTPRTTKQYERTQLASDSKTENACVHLTEVIDSWILERKCFPRHLTDCSMQTQYSGWSLKRPNHDHHHRQQARQQKL